MHVQSMRFPGGVRFFGRSEIGREEEQSMGSVVFRRRLFRVAGSADPNARKLDGKDVEHQRRQYLARHV